MRHLWKGTLSLLAVAAASGFLIVAGGMAQESGQPDQVRPAAHLFPYADRAAFAADALTWETRRRFGMGWEELEGADLHDTEPGLNHARYRFAARMEGGGTLHDPGAFVAGLILPRLGFPVGGGVLTAIVHATLGAVILLHPGLVRRAILLRGIAVLDEPPSPDLGGTEVLLLSGARDPFARMAPALEHSLRGNGAALMVQTLPAGHELSDADIELARGWMSAA